MPRLALASLFVLMALWPDSSQAARISELVDSDFWDRTQRFFSLRDPSLRNALAGSALLGIGCGVMGSFLLVRRLSLMGDALSHAVLPGVALGFLWSMQKDPVAIFIGATVAGLLGAATAHWLQVTTKHKEDANLGFVLAGFYGLGIVLLTMIQNLPEGNKSGLDKFLFGQAAALGREDVLLLAAVVGVCVALVWLFFNEFRLASFDVGFARSIGMPVQTLHYVIMLLLAFAIVSSLQAVGVVLVTAMLVIPPATAYLLTDRFARMIWLSALFGLAAGVLGAFLSFVGKNLPTGPFMVLAAASLFVLAFLFGPKHGVLARWWRQHSRTMTVQKENTLKAMYQVLERASFQRESISLRELAEFRKETLEETRRHTRALGNEVVVVGNTLTLTAGGWKRACEIVRNHRLWELFLTNEAQLASDHVHEDAEVIEHVLSEETILELEKKLNFAQRDPHGKLIPGLEDIHGGLRERRRRAQEAKLP
ncbi:MAG: iron chelate uptake ABC transporter family permease subunit [Verrucomicrobiales bacterium]